MSKKSNRRRGMTQKSWEEVQEFASNNHISIGKDKFYNGKKELLNKKQAMSLIRTLIRVKTKLLIRAEAPPMVLD